MSDAAQETEALRILRQIAPQIASIEERMGRVEDRLTRLETRIDTVLPFLATKADLMGSEGKLSAAIAAKPGRAEFWAGIAAMLGMFAVILTGLAWLLPHLTKATGG